MALLPVCVVPDDDERRTTLSFMDYEKAKLPASHHQVVGQKHFARRIQEAFGRPSTLDVSAFFKDENGPSLDDPLLKGPATGRKVLIQILTAEPMAEYEGVALEVGHILVEPTNFDALKRLEHIHYEREGGHKGVLGRFIDWYHYQHCEDVDGFDVRVVATTQNISEPTVPSS